MDDLKDRAVKGVVALIGRTFFLQAISAVSFFLLGIFLSPTSIGVYIIISAILRIFTLFTDVGLGAALIQKKEELEDKDLATAFTLQEILVIITVVAALAASNLVAQFAHLSADGIFLYRMLVLTLFISSLKVIPSILLERKLAFEKQIIPQIVESLVFNGIVVFLAFKGLEVKSFAWAVIVSSLVGLPVYYLISPWMPAIGISWDRAKKLFNYGIQYQGKSFLAVIKDDLLTFIMSGIVGTSGIGYWGWAQRWAYSPYRLIVDSVTKVTFPAYSRVQESKEALREGIEKSLYFISVFLFPVMTIVSVLIASFIELIPKYAKWQPALPSFYLLAAQAVIAGLTNVLVNVLDATGRVRLTLILMVIWIVLLWISTIGAVFLFGFNGIALAQFIVSLTIVLVIYWVKKVVPFSFISNIRTPLVSSAVTGVILLIAVRFLPHSLIRLALMAGSAVLVYAGILFLIDGKKLTLNVNAIRKAYFK